MANNSNAKKQNNTVLNLIVVLVIAAFVAAGIYATYGKIADNVETKAIENGTKEKTVKYLAKQANMSTADYLAQYGLSLGDTITESSTENNMTDNMTVENYLKYSGNTDTVDQVIEGTGLTGKVTKDTLWKDFLPQVPAISVVGTDSFNQIKQQYPDDITDDMTYGALEEFLNAKMSENQTAEAPANAETTAAPADNGENK